VSGAAAPEAAPAASRAREHWIGLPLHYLFDAIPVPIDS
jgi:hypothetical protein